MILKIQIISFIVSFVYGMFFCFTLEIFSRFLYSRFLFIKVINSFLFVTFHTLFYFVILMKVNYGYIHLYFFLCLFLGYIMCKVLHKWFVKIRKT